MDTTITDDDGTIQLHFRDKRNGDYRPRSIFYAGNIAVMKGLPHPIEYVYGQIPRDLGRDYDLETVQVCASFEGTAILIFHNVDRWYVSTHKKLDAFKGYWADKENTFGRSFAFGLAVADGRRQSLDEIGDPRDYVSEMCDKHLDKTRKYIFVAPAIYSERIATLPVVKWPIPVQTVVMDDKFAVIEGVSTFPGVREPTVDVCPLSMDTLLKMVDTCDYTSLQGYYIRRRNQILQVKLYNITYNKRAMVRGNIASLKFAYMNVRANRADLVLFTETYPDFDWRSVEDDISKTCSNIMEIERYRRRKLPVPQEIPVFDYSKLLRYGCPVTYRYLTEVAAHDPAAFNRVMNARKKAIRKKMYEEQMEENKTEEDQDMFDQMEVIEQFEYTIGTRPA